VNLNGFKELQEFVSRTAVVKDVQGLSGATLLGQHVLDPQLHTALITNMIAGKLFVDFLHHTMRLIFLEKLFADLDMQVVGSKIFSPWHVWARRRGRERAAAATARRTELRRLADPPARTHHRAESDHDASGFGLLDPRGRAQVAGQNALAANVRAVLEPLAAIARAEQAASCMR
jgi:hypothetical protein